MDIFISREVTEWSPKCHISEDIHRKVLRNSGEVEVSCRYLSRQITSTYESYKLLETVIYGFFKGRIVFPRVLRLLRKAECKVTGESATYACGQLCAESIVMLIISLRYNIIDSRIKPHAIVPFGPGIGRSSTAHQSQEISIVGHEEVWADSSKRP